MKKIKIVMLLSFIVIFFSIFSLFQRNSLPDHCIFFSKKTDFYESIKHNKTFFSTTIFWLVSRVPPFKNKIQTGEYLIEKGETVFSILSKVVKGRSVTRKFVVPEGYTIKMIIEKLNNNKNLMGKIEQTPEEASLFPATYFYKKGDSKKSMISKMRNKMQEVMKKTSANKDILILASIIEKESCLSSEKPIIASVFINRIKLNMRLQSDPTVIYALSDGYGILNRPLLRSDWKFASPYNTYRNKGLPPTAICCPSYESIIAALNPASTNYLYFVMAPNGKHHIFSSDYTTHMNNILKRKKSNDSSLKGQTTN